MLMTKLPSGRDNMTNRHEDRVDVMVPLEGSMIAVFWKAGKVTKIHNVEDCQVQATPTYTEVALHTALGEHLLFIVSNDPTIETDMRLYSGNVCAFDGFQLTGPDGTVVERVTVNDNRSIH